MRFFKAVEDRDWNALIGERGRHRAYPLDRDILGVTPPFVKNCTLRPEFPRGIGDIRVDWTYAGQILDPHQGRPGGRATEAQALSLLQARGLTYNFSQMEE